jgi:hypothetical protein
MLFGMLQQHKVLFGGEDGLPQQQRLKKGWKRCPHRGADPAGRLRWVAASLPIFGAELPEMRPSASTCGEQPGGGISFECGPA